jgi:hypothetical protein
VPYRGNYDGFGESAIYSGSVLSPLDIFLFLPLNIFLKRQRFMSSEEVAAKATRALTEVSEKLFLGILPKLNERYGNSNCPVEMV